MIINDIYKAPNGTVLMLLHEGGIYDIKTNSIINGNIIAKREIKNLIVNNASKLMAMRMAPGNTHGYIDTSSGSYMAGNTVGEFDTSGLKYLAVGTGQLKDQTLPYDENTNPSTWNLQSPPEEDISTTKLTGELYRKKFTDWKFLDASGNLSLVPTNILLLSTTFLEDEAVGPIVEMGLFGGDTATDDKDTGDMFNYKTCKVWNKENDCRLSIIWKLTF